MITRAIVRTGRDRMVSFEDPFAEILVAAGDLAAAVPRALDRLEALVEKTGLTAVGFLTYEAAAAYGLATHPPGRLPPLCFVLFRHSHEVSPSRDAQTDASHRGYTVGAWRNSVDITEYREQIRRIRSHLAAGESYQINYTFPMYASFTGDTETFFHDICSSQNGAYAAYLEIDGGHSILSASPELFLERNGSEFFSLPMKGTAARGLNRDEDDAAAEALRSSPKERAENLMITDMIRNDLGRIAVPGSVRVPRLFSVERYPRVLQMVSRVEARSDASLAGVIAAMFPCASITGAPKKRTMELIRELESTPREIYTGTIGVVYPGRRFRFNVAIRTVLVDHNAGRATFGVGGGIVWDSDADREYEECATKANILTTPDPPVTLMETLRWNESTGIFLYEGHRQRLQASAEYFDIPLTVPGVADLLDHDSLYRRIHRVVRNHGSSAEPTEDWRVRVLVNRSGLRIETERLTRFPESKRKVAVSRTPVPGRCLWTRHKTTNRTVYEDRRAEYPEADDVLLCNEEGNLTESCIASIFVERTGADGRTRYLATPPLSDGLLPGVFRDYLLRPPPGVTPWTPGALPVKEETVPLSVLDAVRRGESALYLVNAVRGWMRTVLDRPDRPRSILRS